MGCQEQQARSLHQLAHVRSRTCSEGPEAAHQRLAVRGQLLRTLQTRSSEGLIRDPKQANTAGVICKIQAAACS